MKIVNTTTVVLIMLRILLATMLVSDCAAAAQGQMIIENYGGRSLFVWQPAQLPAAGERALVVVMHGAYGNAQRIATDLPEHALNMNAAAESNGFVVAYLNGTQVSRKAKADQLAWNAGECCGAPAIRKTDDVAYIQDVVNMLVDKYGIDRRRVFGMGFSNGAMMAQRLMCETDLFAAAVPIAGTLDIEASSCPPARGKRILAIHGDTDQNIPLSGSTEKSANSDLILDSEARSKEVFTRSGASYELQVIEGVGHSMPDINAALLKTEKQTVAQKTSRFFGLSR